MASYVRLLFSYNFRAPDDPAYVAELAPDRLERAPLATGSAQPEDERNSASERACAAFIGWLGARDNRAGQVRKFVDFQKALAEFASSSFGATSPNGNGIGIGNGIGNGSSISISSAISSISSFSNGTGSSGRQLNVTSTEQSEPTSGSGSASGANWLAIASSGGPSKQDSRSVEQLECFNRLQLSDYYANYDIFVGLRIASWLTVLFLVFIAFVAYKTSSGSRRAATSLQRALGAREFG